VASLSKTPITHVAGESAGNEPQTGKGAVGLSPAAVLPVTAKTTAHSTGLETGGVSTSYANHLADPPSYASAVASGKGTIPPVLKVTQPPPPSHDSAVQYGKKIYISLVT